MLKPVQGQAQGGKGWGGKGRKQGKVVETLYMWGVNEINNNIFLTVL